MKLSVCGVVDKNPVSVEVQLQGVGNEDLSKGKCNIVAVSKNAFRGVESIEKVTLSSYIKSIGDSAFYGCSSIKTIELKSKTPPVLGKDVFEGLVPPVTLIVPDGCSGAYLNDPVWKSLIEEPSTVVKESSVSRKLVGTYSVSGTKIPSDEANSYKGVKISVYDDGDAVKSVVR